MDTILNYLDGKKTLFACALGLALIGAVGLHWIVIPAAQMQQLTDALLFVTLAALRVSK